MVLQRYIITKKGVGLRTGVSNEDSDSSQPCGELGKLEVCTVTHTATLNDGGAYTSHCCSSFTLTLTRVNHLLWSLITCKRALYDGRWGALANAAWVDQCNQ